MNRAYLETAEKIGARLCRDAIWYEGQCSWTSDFLDGESIAHGALEPYLYDGSSGIALFLWRLATVTGERIFRLTAEAALRHALARVPMATGCGLYSGALGVHYVASEIRQACDEDAVLRAAVPDPSCLDVIEGSAGAIAVLVKLHARTGSAQLFETAMRHGELLIQEASCKMIPGSGELTGFSHGASGIAWALLELHRVTGDQRFREAARQAFQYESSCFNAEEQNWPDYRGEEPSYPAYWCHGAAGIALCRVRAWQLTGDPELLAEAQIALGTMLKRSASLTNFSLCHGHAGNSSILIYASKVLGEQSYLHSAEATAGIGIERFEHRRVPWPCGLPDANETPDLMLGLAGIGYFYLQLADPAQIPPVLILASA